MTKFFLILYNELYYRHIYAKLKPTLDQILKSWKNYCSLFDFLLNQEIDLNLPKPWLWDIVDEFIYQFQHFCTYRAKLKNKSNDEVQILKTTQAWNVVTVINYFEALINKAKLSKKPTTTTSEEPVQNVHTIFRMLGYFSLVGLLRIHTLLGDYYLALKTCSQIDTTEKVYSSVTACHITLYYYLGFVYMMVRKYSLAIKVLSNILLFISRTKQFHTNLSYQYAQIEKKTIKCMVSWQFAFNCLHKELKKTFI